MTKGICDDALSPAFAGLTFVIRHLLGFRAAALHPRLYSAARVRGLSKCASDLYSLAATLHHLLAGEPPVDARVRGEVMRYQTPDPLRLLHQVNPQIPPAVAVVIARAMALPTVALAIYFAFIAGRSSGAAVSRTNGITIPGGGLTDVQGTVKLPTGVAPPGSVGTFDFETVTLDKDGNAISRQKKRARHFGEDLGEDVILELVEIPGGEFTIGSPKEEEGRISIEGPQRRVTLPSFWMGKYEVTQEQWREVAKQPIVKSDFNPDPSFPLYKHGKTTVSGVSWNDAVEFCKRLSRKTGRAYRLPTEAEWEYAARAGTTTPFAFGLTVTPVVANCSQKRPTTVGSLGVANAFGLFDMSGNVWEWRQDERRDDYNGLSADGSWTKDGDPQFRRVRGGSWGGAELKLCRSALRFQDAPDAHSLIYGFRVVTSAVAR
jgi:formylglycine-generating enzyme required for sulfatase activity